MKGLIICGFPGVGKSAVESISHAMNIFDYNDMESSAYGWITGLSGKRERNPHFPECYVDDIEMHASQYGYPVVMVASHKEVRDEMKRRGIPYIIVAPEKSLKDEYMARYLVRRSNYGLIKQIFDHWDEWLDEIEQDGAPVIHLKAGQYLSDILIPEIARKHLYQETIKQEEQT